MPKDTSPPDIELVPATGRTLALPPGPVFHLHRAADSRHEIGEFRAWAGYKDLGTDAATDGLVHLQHVVSCAGTDKAGRTGVHCHLAHAHIVIPTSGRGVFSYDGIHTEAVPGLVIVQHGGTVHDQFEYSYAPAPRAETFATPVSLEPAAAGAPAQAFSFLELFVPRRFANVEIVPPQAVTAEIQASCWDHPYHTPGARFSCQAPVDPDAAWRPLAGAPHLEVRDAATWTPSAGLVATWILRPAAGAAGDALFLGIPGQNGGLDILYLASGEASLRPREGETLTLGAGDCLTCSHGLAGLPFEMSQDARLLWFYIAPAVEGLKERTAAEIARLEALGPAIITRRELREPGDARPVNGLRAG